MEVKSIFATRFKKLYKAKRWTQVALASRFNLSTDTIKGWTRNTTGLPTLEHLLDICKEFDVDLGYLIGQQDFKKAASQRIHDLTGLNENTTNFLCQLKESDRRIIDALFADTESMKYLLAAIGDYSLSHNSTLIMKDETLKYEERLRGNGKSVPRHKSIDTFTEIIDRIYEDNTQLAIELRKARLYEGMEDVLIEYKKMDAQERISLKEKALRLLLSYQTALKEIGDNSKITSLNMEQVLDVTELLDALIDFLTGED